MRYIQGADIIQKWEYIHTLSADMNELYEIALRPMKNKNEDLRRRNI